MKNICEGDLFHLYQCKNGGAAGVTGFQRAVVGAVAVLAMGCPSAFLLINRDNKHCCMRCGAGCCVACTLPPPNPPFFRVLRPPWWTTCHGWGGCCAYFGLPFCFPIIQSVYLTLLKELRGWLLCGVHTGAAKINQKICFFANCPNPKARHVHSNIKKQQLIKSIKKILKF